MAFGQVGKKIKAKTVDVPCLLLAIFLITVSFLAVRQVYIILMIHICSAGLCLIRYQNTVTMVRSVLAVLEPAGISVWSVVFLKYPKNKHLYIVEEISTINPRFFMQI